MDLSLKNQASYGIAIAMASKGAKGVTNHPYDTEEQHAQNILAEIKTNINHDAWATPEAKTAVWLASDENGYVTGTTQFVDKSMALFPGFTTNGYRRWEFTLR
ncbi:hypothetical protein [Chryseolinea lacunae]|uniref:Uncharacterized protein n=1 Tax=Chryseolinea lacunae TaxID=2801331 RepID=A0ABS1KXI0_9BACT|nr:hypothetical protein [Chryseolinea lacunae]MBL0744175.1 hypothetical protein [Chryseolinea lacunae]